MKNDIDSILDSMFRGGRLQFKSNQQPEKQEETSSQPASAFHTTAAQEAQQALMLWPVPEIACRSPCSRVWRG